MKRKVFGIPTIAIILIAALVAGGIYAAFFWERQVPVSVRIVGAEIEAYQDEACTIPLTAIDFGELRAGEQSTTVPFWLLNSGEDTVYAALAQTGLDPLLGFFEGDANAVPADPNKLPVVTGSDYEPEVPEVPGYWEETATTTMTSAYFSPTENTEILVDDTNGFPSSGIVKVQKELIAYTSTMPNSLNGLTRGIDGTIPDHHDAPSPVILMNWVDPIPAVPESGGDTFNLASGEVLQVSIYLVADSSIDRNEKPFTLLIFAQDTEF